MINDKIPKKILKKMDEEYVKIIDEIINHPEFIKRKNYHHHENRSVYNHCLIVSINSYYLAKKLRLDYKKAAIGGLLHDFYYKDWQLNKEKVPFFKMHGFVHAKEAVENSKLTFPNLVDKKVENIIKRHMFPLNIIPPLYLESWLICFVDKYCSLEIFKTPTKLTKYIGIRQKGGKND